MPRDLSDLLDGMRQTEPVPPERLAKVALRLEKTLAIAPMDVPLRDQVEAATRRAPGGGSLRNFLQHRGMIGLSMYLSGALTVLAVQHESRNHREPTAEALPAPALPAERPTASASADPWVTVTPPDSPPSPALPVAAPSARTVAGPLASPSVRPAVSKLAEERQLILVARSALARGRPKEALAALAEHARRFATGQLEEERDSLRVEALVASGSYGEARTVAAHFDESYPDSMLRGSVRHALQSIP
jgi:hypothetical protein